MISSASAAVVGRTSRSDGRSTPTDAAGPALDALSVPSLLTTLPKLFVPTLCQMAQRRRNRCLPPTWGQRFGVGQRILPRRRRESRRGWRGSVAGVDSIGFRMRFLAGYCLVGGTSTALKLAKSRGLSCLCDVSSVTPRPSPYRDVQLTTPRL